MNSSFALSNRCLSDTATPCTFCRIVRNGTEEIHDFGTMVAFLDSYPVSQGHFLVVPKRHLSDYFELSDDELRDSNRALRDLRVNLLSGDSSIAGFNIGVNCGVAAGQTVEHAHIHLIPRRQGDTPNPRGGVRGVIPAKMTY
ncbi:HIT family protein [Streptomyces sp. NPDC056452]|uniref:HIT family protein n=1 Tax=Streptomyces sp. NPDC056452 TaxID=3345821 RepID=UPI0036B3BA2C